MSFSSSSSSPPTDIPLHSPPPNFLGTPFTTPTKSNIPFEYPFPIDPSNPSSSSSSQSPTNSLSPASSRSSSSTVTPTFSTTAGTTGAALSPSREKLRAAVSGNAAKYPPVVPIPPSLLEKVQQKLASIESGQEAEGDDGGGPGLSVPVGIVRARRRSS